MKRGAPHIRNQSGLFATRGNRTSISMRNRARLGKWMGRPPHGFYSMKITVIMRDKKIAPVIDRALRMRLYSKVTKEKILAYCAKKDFHISMRTLNSIFSNPFYCGYICTRATQWKMIKGEFKGLITLSQFNKLQKIIRSNN